MTDSPPKLVHNHGTEEGPGLACREQRIAGQLVGECIARPREEEATAPTDEREELDTMQRLKEEADDTDALLREADEWPFPGQADFLIQRLASALRASRAREAALRKQILDWENQEAAVCPEDVGFAEYIRSLTARVEAAERERDALRIDASNANYMRLEALERTGERYRKLDAAFGSHGPSFDTLIDKAVESVAQLEATTSRIAQLEQSLALSEDKVKALVEGKVWPIYRGDDHEDGLPPCAFRTVVNDRWTDFPTFDEAYTAYAASLTQQGDPK